MDSRRIDLHAHTHYSDGALSPFKLVKSASMIGLCALAITDHDTTAGVKEACAAGRRYGVEIIPGVEISAAYDKGALHILGYLLDYQDENFQQKLGIYIESRNRRNPKILTRLKHFGYSLEMEEVLRQAEGRVIQRPHIALAMVKRGYVQSVQEAFDRFLAQDAPAYVPKEVFSPEECIQIVHDAGGLAVLAHPGQLETGSLEATRREIRRFHTLGIDGIEAYHGSCPTDHSQAYVDLAQELGLIVTGGSDYHDDRKYNITLGKVRGLPFVPYHFLDRMKEVLAARV